jgi:hypothetical protein
MTSLKGKRYRLIRGGVSLGEIQLREDKGDFPWYGGDFTPSEHFDSVRSLFDQEYTLICDNSLGEWQRVWTQIKQPGLVLEAVDAPQEISNVLIHIQGAEASWRC